MGVAKTQDEIDRRSTDRIAMEVGTTCRVPATPHRVTVLDLSHGGCRVRFGPAQLQTGSTVHLDLDPASSVTGQVVWVHAGHAGIRFHRRLHSNLAVHMGIEQRVVEASPEPAEPATPIAGVFSHWIRRAFGMPQR